MQLNGHPHPNPPVGPAAGLEDRPNPEVIPAPTKAKRRQFTVREKLQVLADTDVLSDGQIGAYLREKGLYWSHLSGWRRLRESDALAKAVPNKRGKKKAEVDPSVREIAGLRKELAKVQEQLRRAVLVLEVQKKVLSLSGECAPSGSK